MNNYLKDEKEYSMKIPRKKKMYINYNELGVKTLVNTARSFWEILCIWRTILNYLTKMTKQAILLHGNKYSELKKSLVSLF